MYNKGISYDEAHRLTNVNFDYEMALKEFLKK